MSGGDVPMIGSYASHFDTWNCRPCNHGVVRSAWKRTNTPHTRNPVLVRNVQSTGTPDNQEANMELKIALEKQLSHFSNPDSPGISRNHHIYIFRLTSRSYGQWCKPMDQVPPEQVQGRLGLSPLDRSLAAAGDMWRLHVGSQ